MHHTLQLFLSLALEGFPISSSGHVHLCTHLLNTYCNIHAPMMPSSLEHMIHAPIACAVALFFIPSWWPIVRRAQRHGSYILQLVQFGVIVELLTVAWYALFAYVGTQWWSLPVGFAITALVCASVVYAPRAHAKNNLLTVFHALILGIAQGFALLPGISRFGTTFVVARYLGFASQRAFELSFMIEWPISIAGGLLGIYAMHRESVSLSSIDMVIIGSGMVALIGGLYIMKRIIDNGRFGLFSWYMIAVAILSLILV